MSELTIIVEDHPSPDAIRTVINNLIEYNNLSQAEKEQGQQLSLSFQERFGEVERGKEKLLLQVRGGFASAKPGWGSSGLLGN